MVEDAQRASHGLDAVMVFTDVLRAERRITIGVDKALKFAFPGG